MALFEKSLAKGASKTLFEKSLAKTSIKGGIKKGTYSRSLIGSFARVRHFFERACFIFFLKSIYKCLMI